ncbi:MAG: DUF3786 domain-containing protein [Desulfobacteraceae bacterium]|nr:DUF3786 domain-containing protein [Desulfobacteraceae bacterium]
MTDNYKKIAEQNLARLYSDLPGDLEANLPAHRDGDNFLFTAFGKPCVITPKGISLGKEETSSVFDILISLYALNVTPEVCIPSPFKAFKELPSSMPYVGAFTTHTEQVLVPHVDRIKACRENIMETLGGSEAPEGTRGDLSMVLRPLPKIALCYLFYEADEEFPAAATCLYSANSERFLPVDALADVGEYTSRTILNIVNR